MARPRIEATYAIVVSKGTPASKGSRHDPIGSIIGDGEDFHEQIKTIEPGEQVNIWARTSDPFFDFMSLYVIGKGTVSVAWTVDTPVSAANLAASGSREETYSTTVGCSNPWVLASCEVMMSPTVRTTADNNGVPAVLAATDKTYGFVYRVFVQNTSNDPVTYRFNASAGEGAG